MKAAIVERYWSWVNFRASITFEDVEGPDGKGGIAGGFGDSPDETDENDEILLIDGMSALCLPATRSKTRY